MNLAVFLPNWIGDVAMATPAVRALRQHFANAHITAVLAPYVADVMQGAPWFDSQILLSKKGNLVDRWFRAARELRQKRIDLAVLFPNSFRSAAVAWLGGCRNRIGYDRSWRGLLLSNRLESLRDGRGKFVPTPAIDVYNRLAEVAGTRWPGYRMQLFTTEVDERSADIVWDRAGFNNRPEVVCLNPGAAYGSAKYWDVEHFATLARDLTDRRGSGVLVLCGPSEKDLARNIVQLSARPAVRTLADLCDESAQNGPRISIGLTKACVRRADLLVTTDSGPRHFAQSFDRPVVSLFGPTHIAWTETYFTKAVHLQKKVECGPCSRRVCPIDHRCMKLLVPDDVYLAATDLLTRFPPAKLIPRERKAS